jgi:hypothetical protein
MNRTRKIHNYTIKISTITTLGPQMVQLGRTLVNVRALNDKERMATFELKSRIKVNPNRRSKIEPADHLAITTPLSYTYTGT